MATKKIEKKFYVGSRAILSPHNTHAKATLAEAIEEAIEKAHDEDAEQIIVQIIKVVKPSRPPVDIFDVE